MKNLYNSIIPIIVILFICFSCKKEQNINCNINKYLHISHTRTNSNPLINNDAINKEYTNFDIIMLGGDLAWLTSFNDSTMNYIDSIFDIGNINTLWSLGNHDYSDLNRISQYTKKPAFYSTFKNGITFIILDTQDSLSNIIGDQKKEILATLDTLQNSTHLIILHHKLIWMYDNINLQQEISNISNAPLGNCFNCLNPNNFNSEIYPELLKVKQRGVEIVCIGGDIGRKTNKFEHTTDEGIHFLASGIEENKINNNVLVLYHDMKRKSLLWEFKSLKELE